MKRRFKISTKILFITISISLVAILVSSIVSGFTARNALERAAFARLTAVRELKAQQIKSYFELIVKQIQTLAAEQKTIGTLQILSYATSQIETSLKNNDAASIKTAQSYYENIFKKRLKELNLPDSVVADSMNLVPKDAIALFLQNSYVVENNSDVQRTAVLAGKSDFTYRTTHRDIHPWFKDFLANYGYYDIFLIEPEKGRIVYSVAKEIDFGTSLFSGPHANSNLAEIAKKAKNLKQGEYIFADFATYAPSLEAPAAFIATPVFSGENLVGILAFQMPIDEINKIMTSNKNWSNVGLGKTGETYLVGKDLLLRNQSRFLIEDREKYLEMIRKTGTSENIVQQISNLGTSTGLQKVDTIGTRAAISGKSGGMIFEDYRGIEVLSSYKPLGVPGLNWAIMSEIDKKEAFADADRLIDYLLLMASIVLAVTIYTAYYFSLSLTRPLRALESSAAALTAGELDKKISVQSSDEIGDLAQNFEHMRVSLKETFLEVENQKSDLESNVAARTAELDAASEKLNLALASMPNGIYMLDSELNFVMSNDHYAELLDIPRGLVAEGKSVRDVVQFMADRGDYGKGDSAAITEQRVSKIAKSRSGNTTITTPAGRTIELRHALVEGDGTITVASDISDLKENEQALLAQNEELQTIQRDLKESEQRIAKIIQSSPDGIITMDKRGIIDTFSDSAEQIFGYYSDEIVGKNIKILMPKEIALEHDYYLEKYVPGSTSSVVGKKRIVDGVRKDGSIFALEIAVQEVWLGDDLIFLGLARDITERIKLENEIVAAREQAEQANETKSAFLANMSHELRTPMNAIIGYSEMLAEEAEDDGLDDMAKILNNITSAGMHLLSLINDVLDLSKIEAGKMELFLETFPVEEMANEVVNTSVSLIEKNSNKLELAIDDDAGEMHADSTKIKQILLNLISNAAKFTKEGTITIGATRLMEGDTAWIRLSVSDTGIGIPEDKLDHIFKEFAQADESTTRDFGGTGLGLALTQRFCEMMGGTIKVESVIGKGSSFIVTIPATVEKQHEGLEAEALIQSTAPKSATGDDTVPEEKTAEMAIAELANVPSKSGKPVVLVIDDDQTARALLQRSLENEGCHVVTAHSGSEGLTAAAALRPNLITLDVLMPGMDGWTVLKKLKADPDLKDIPVVMISMVGDKGMSYELGAVDTLQKPVRRSQLQALIARHSTSADKSVLIVEDDDAARAVMKKYLEAEKWIVEEAENGAIGLDKASVECFGLILLDLMMPVMDGFEFLQRLRHDEGPSAKSPVVVVSAKDLTAEDRGKLLNNVEEIVSKDGRDIEEIMGEVRTALDTAGFNQAVAEEAENTKT